MSQLSAIQNMKTLSLNTFNNLIRNNPDAQMFVLNRSKPRSQLALSVLMDNNVPDVVVVPASWLPCELTLKAQLPNLLKSATLKRALSLGDIVIADPESVYELFRTSERARADYLTTYGHEWVDPAADGSTLLDLTDDADADTDINRERQNSGDNAPKRYSDNELVNDLIIQSRAGSDASAITNAIVNSIDSLTKDDLLCIANNVTDSEVKDFCLSSTN